MSDHANNTPTITLGFLVHCYQRSRFEWGHLQCRRQIQMGWVKVDDFWTVCEYISETVQDRDVQ